MHKGQGQACHIKNMPTIKARFDSVFGANSNNQILSLKFPIFTIGNVYQVNNDRKRPSKFNGEMCTINVTDSVTVIKGTGEKHIWQSPLSVSLEQKTLLEYKERPHIIKLSFRGYYVQLQVDDFHIALHIYDTLKRFETMRPFPSVPSAALGRDPSEPICPGRRNATFQMPPPPPYQSNAMFRFPPPYPGQDQQTNPPYLMSMKIPPPGSFEAIKAMGSLFSQFFNQMIQQNQSQQNPVLDSLLLQGVPTVSSSNRTISFNLQPEDTESDDEDSENKYVPQITISFANPNQGLSFNVENINDTSQTQNIHYPCENDTLSEEFFSAPRTPSDSDQDSHENSEPTPPFPDWGKLCDPDPYSNFSSNFSFSECQQEQEQTFQIQEEEEEEKESSMINSNAEDGIQESEDDEASVPTMTTNLPDINELKINAKDEEENKKEPPKVSEPKRRTSLRIKVNEIIHKMKRVNSPSSKESPDDAGPEKKRIRRDSVNKKQKVDKTDSKGQEDKKLQTSRTSGKITKQN